MLLQALNEFYDRATRENLIQEAAFASKKVRWFIPLKIDGSLAGVGFFEPEAEIFFCPRTARAKKGREAEFLCDGIDSVFGFNPDVDNPKNEDMLAKKYADFWRQIEEGFLETKSDLLKAILLFREKYFLQDSQNFLRWGVTENAKPDEKPAWLIKTSTGKEEKFKSDNFTFQVEGQNVLFDESLRQYWRNCYAKELESKTEDAELGVCLVSGKENVPLVASHLPPIKNIPGGQPTGAYLVSFEKSSPSFSSYGKVQSYNSPVSFQAVEAYTNALNFLVSNPKHRFRIGNTALCFWAQKSDEVSDLIFDLFEQGNEKTLKDFLKKPFVGDDNLTKFKEEKFYSVTLSGNSGRIVVRNWMQTTVQQAIKNFEKWFEDLDIQIFGYSSSQDGKSALSLYRLASTIVRKADARKKKEEEKFISEIQTELYRTALEYKVPSVMLAKRIVNRLALDISKWGVDLLETPTPVKLLKRISDAREPFPPISQSRFALLRLIVNRNRQENEKMIEPKLNNEIEDYAYNCGRLLAVFQKLQSAAHGINFDGAGVVEKYYGTASSSPNSAFGILWRLHQHHLKKLARENKGASVAIKNQIAEIATHFKQPNPKMPPQFPRSFNLQEQGRFALGFYQQIAADREARDAYFQNKKSEENKGEENQ
jgi:CRISPR-associated protein Csd1